MVVYICIFILFFIFIFQSNIYKGQRNVLGFILLLFLIIISGFRYDVGMDYSAYETIFNQISDGHSVEGEIGFRYLCRLVSFVGGNAQLMFLICGIITMTLIYKSYKMFSPDIVMSLTIFLCLGQLYLTTFNAVRQCVAIAIFSYAIRYIIQKSFVKYVVSIVIASMFHSTAFILLPLYWILKMHFSRIVKFIALILLLFSAGIIIQIILNSPYAAYLQFENFSSESSIINYIYLLLGGFIIVMEPKLMRGNNDRIIFININFICTCLFLLNIVFSGTPLVMVVGRLNYYFICFYAIVFVRIIYDLKILSNRRIAEFCLYVILFAMYIRTTLLLGESYHIVPYRINIELF